MTSEENYTLLVRHIRRRINDTVLQTTTGEKPPVFELDEIKDEIDLAISYIDAGEGVLDITTVRRQHWELVILRVWSIFCKMLAFDSAKFFYMQQTAQTYDKGQRTAHYLNVADNIEKLFDDAMDRQGFTGTVTVGDIVVLDRATCKENTYNADLPPESVLFLTYADLTGVGDFEDYDYKLTWERSTAWDFAHYKIYKGNSANVNKDTGTIVETVGYSDTTELVVNLADATEDVYFVIYVVDNRNHFSKPSDVFKVPIETGSV